MEVSPDQKLLAYAEDTKGGEKFNLHVIEIATRKQLMAAPVKVTLLRELISTAFIVLCCTTSTASDAARPIRNFQLDGYGAGTSECNVLRAWTLALA